MDGRERERERERGHYVESLFPITIEWYWAIPTSEEIHEGGGGERRGRE